MTDSAGTFEIEDLQGVILREIAEPSCNRADIAITYSLCLRRGMNSVDYGKINHAIMDRWSFSGLEWIKRKAWKLVGGVTA